MEEDLKALSAIDEFESEENEEVDIVKRASDRYDFIQLIDSIGTPEFRSIYENIMYNEYSLQDKRNLAIEILEKIKDVYNIELTLSNTPSVQEVIDVFKFVQFLEYKYVRFFADVWKFIDVDLRSDIRNFCIMNSDKIMEIIEEQIETHFLPTIISTFLRTYNKKGMINLFIGLTEKAKMMIVLKIEEGELKNV